MRITRPGWLRTLVVASLATLFGLPHSGCTPDYVTDNQAPVSLFINAINDGAPLDSDVLSGSAQGGFFVVEDEVLVAIANRSKNPNFTNTPQVAMAIDVDRYEVRYFRSDGRNTEGVDVPYKISGNIRFVIDVEDNQTFSLEVVRRQAKLEPPLRNLVGGGGELVLTCFAEVTLHGRTTAGQAVKAVGHLQIDFADITEQ